MRHIPLARMRATNNLGVPQQSYEIYFYQSGSSTVFQDTYQEEAKSTANANPVVSDSNGWFPPVILDGGAYNVVYKDADGNTIWSEDPVTDLDTLVNALISAASDGTPAAVQKQSYTYGVATGTADAMSLTLSPAPTAYTDGMRVQCRGATGANTVTNPTINVNALGTKTITKQNGEPLLVGDIAGADHTLDMIYNSNDDTFILQNPSFSERQRGLTDTGAADAYAAAAGIDAYTTNDIVWIDIANTNTGASTLNLDSLGVKNIKLSSGGSDPAAGDIQADRVHGFLYDGTSFILVNPYKVTNDMMSADSVDSDQYVDGSIDRVHLNSNIRFRELLATHTFSSDTYSNTTFFTDNSSYSVFEIELDSCVITTTNSQFIGCQIYESAAWKNSASDYLMSNTSSTDNPKDALTFNQGAPTIASNPEISGSIKIFNVGTFKAVAQSLLVYNSADVRHTIGVSGVYDGAAATADGIRVGDFSSVSNAGSTSPAAVTSGTMRIYGIR